MGKALDAFLKNTAALFLRREIFREGIEISSFRLRESWIPARHDSMVWLENLGALWIPTNLQLYLSRSARSGNLAVASSTPMSAVQDFRSGCLLLV
jgi:hypothetical protein